MIVLKVFLILLLGAFTVVTTTIVSVSSESLREAKTWYETSLEKFSQPKGNYQSHFDQLEQYNQSKDAIRETFNKTKIDYPLKFGDYSGVIRDEEQISVTYPQNEVEKRVKASKIIWPTDTQIQTFYAELEKNKTNIEKHIATYDKNKQNLSLFKTSNSLLYGCMWDSPEEKVCQSFYYSLDFDYHLSVFRLAVLNKDQEQIKSSIKSMISEINNMNSHKISMVEYMVLLSLKKRMLRELYLLKNYFVGVKEIAPSIPILDNSMYPGLNFEHFSVFHSTKRNTYEKIEEEGWETLFQEVSKSNPTPPKLKKESNLSNYILVDSGLYKYVLWNIDETLNNVHLRNQACKKNTELIANQSQMREIPESQMHWYNLFYHSVGAIMDNVSTPNYNNYIEKWHYSRIQFKKLEDKINSID